LMLEYGTGFWPFGTLYASEPRAPMS
jgi:hypothetical protein